MTPLEFCVWLQKHFGAGAHAKLTAREVLDIRKELNIVLKIHGVIKKITPESTEVWAKIEAGLDRVMHEHKQRQKGKTDGDTAEKQIKFRG